MLKRLLLTLFLVAVAVIVGYKWAVNHLQQLPLPVTEPLYTVNSGSSAAALCLQWQQQQLLKPADCLMLRVYLKLHPQQAHLQQGVYRVPPNPRLLELLALFRSGKEAQFALTLIEGETAQQAWQRLKAAPYLKQDLNDLKELLPPSDWPAQWGEQPVSPEALFLPDTYYYTAGTAASDVLRRAQQLLITELQLAWDSRQGDLPLQHPYQLLILASIVEKESSYAPEKPLVSSVFVNRLRKNMRLQTDPTVIYGLSNFDGNITRADLRNPHRYNTYRHHGLPPGPIALVSRSSLQAAAQPAQTDYYYFVSMGEGKHHFSETLQQHNAAVNKYILGKKDD